MGINESNFLSPNFSSNLKSNNTIINEVNRNNFDFQFIIGKGGFGKVWRVLFKKTLKLYALKEMEKVKVIDRKCEKSIQSERDFLSKLRHPFIVNMIFSFQDYDNLYLGLDLLTGGDLRYHISMKQTFSEQQTKFFIACVILALEFIHGNKIIHRDIKPENLVIDENGYIRLTDFGIAKLCLEDDSSETSGTPGYMAPEVLCGLNHSYPVDFFAIGAMGYEFMKGERPYIGKTRKDIKQLVLRRQAMIYHDDIPNGWSIESVDFINRLLKRKEVQRLGYERGIIELKEHNWFKGFDWDTLSNKTMNSPFTPPSSMNYDKRYCEAKDVINEETLQRYQVYKQRDNYNSIFENYTFLSKIEIENYVNSKKTFHHSVIKHAHQSKELPWRSNSTITSKFLLKNNEANNNENNKSNFIQLDRERGRRFNQNNDSINKKKEYIDIRKQSLSFLRGNKAVNISSSNNKSHIFIKIEDSCNTILKVNKREKYDLTKSINLFPFRLPSLSIVSSPKDNNQLNCINKKKFKLAIPLQFNSYKPYSLQKSNSTNSIGNPYLKGNSHVNLNKSPIQ